MKYFKIGARYGDKFSQASIGFMYLKSRGVPRNVPVACAWLTIAAERGYPKMVQARDHFCSHLSPAQIGMFHRALEKLRPVYADRAAKPRMKLALAKARRGLTGSHTGYDFGVITAPPPGKQTRCNGATALQIGAVAVPKSGCGRYNAELWNAKTYFAARDAQWSSSVTVGKLEDINSTPSDPGQRRDTTQGDAGGRVDHAAKHH